MLGYAPGAGQHGYLWWLAWLSHNTRTLFSVQDANGPYRPGVHPVQLLADRAAHQHRVGVRARRQPAQPDAAAGALRTRGPRTTPARRLKRRTLRLMVTARPSLARIITMVLFALSCFGLLLFLWLSFGGAIPFNPQGYRFRASFPNAQQLATQADVRIAGVSVGKVVDKSLDPLGNRTIATIELNKQYAPIHVDARAILREKTIIGETYVELTPGSPTRAGAPRRGAPGPDQRSAGGPARRHPQCTRPGDPPGLPGVAAAARDRPARQRPEPQQRARQPAPVLGRRERRPASPRRRARRHRAPDPQRRHRVRVADQQPVGAPQPGHERGRDVRHHGRREQPAGGHLPRVPDLPDRDEGDVRAPSALRARHRSARPGARPGGTPARTRRSAPSRCSRRACRRCSSTSDRW